MRKGLGFIIALGLGGAIVYGVHNANTPEKPDVRRQPSTQPYISAQPNQTPSPQAPPDQQTTLSNDDHYINSDGDSIHSPADSSEGVPAGATAQCRDGSYSFSRHRQGTCSHHGGVSRWL